jgi:signal transduction histidine kinase
MSDSLPKRLSLVVEEWEPLIEVDLVPLELDVKSISRSQSSNICDFINECLSNALRHGQATKANVEIAEAVTDILVIVSNNGELLGAVESGLGSKIFTQLSNSRWDIKNKIDGTGVRVSALFSR